LLSDGTDEVTIVLLRDGRNEGKVIGEFVVPEIVPEDELAKVACVIDVIDVTAGKVATSAEETIVLVPDSGGNVVVATSVMPTDNAFVGVGEEAIGVLVGSVTAAKEPVKPSRVFSTSEVSEVTGSAVGRVVFKLVAMISPAGVLLAGLGATRGGNGVNSLGRTGSAVGAVVMVEALVEFPRLLSGTVTSRLFPLLPLCLCRCSPRCRCWRC
jgi:hypothetical protein